MPTPMTKDNTMPRLSELAERCEQAAAEQQAELLSWAWEVVHGWPLRLAAGSDAARFLLMLNCEAYESAALTLVPKEAGAWGGARWNVEEWAGNGVYPEHVRAMAWVAGADRAFAATPALALAAAALRARSTGGDGDE